MQVSRLLRGQLLESLLVIVSIMVAVAALTDVANLMALAERDFSDAST